ncbi:MAG: hypothetical protein ACFFCT_12175 [Candidatus Odinarchaeota archaeon]
MVLEPPELQKRVWLSYLVFAILFSLVPIYIYNRLTLIAIIWLVTLIIAVGIRSRIKHALIALFGGRWLQCIAVLISANLAVSALIIHEANYAGELQWGVEVGDQFSYSLEALGFFDYYYDHHCLPLNNSVIIFNITSLPEIPFYCDQPKFSELIVNRVKGYALFENGSSMNQECEIIVTSLISKALLPVGDWAYIDTLYDDQGAWFSFSDGDFFHFGLISQYSLGAPGWSAKISLDDGVPITVTEHPPYWHLGIVTLTLLS